MFEQFNLIHFDMEKNMDEKLSMDIGKADYKLSGSFDFLLPHFSSNDIETSFKERMFLQSFCVMDNDSAYYTKRVDYESLLLSYTFGGCGKLIYEGREYKVAPGKGFIIDCRRKHEYKTDGSNWKHMDIHLWGEQALLLYQYLKDMKIVLFSHSSKDMVQMTEKLLTVYQMHSSFRDLYIANSLSNLLCEILRHAEDDGLSSIPVVYREMIQYMETNYTSAVTLDELAEKFHISKYHLSREFHKHTGFSPKEYLIKLRISHAIILLSQSDLSIEDVAARSGFSNMSNFIEQIKKQTGMTPSELKKISKQ